MAKRFIDTDIWKKKWFRKLDPKMKCAWHFLITQCDAAGVWEVDTDLMGIFIGEDIELSELMKTFAGRLDLFKENKIWIVDYCDFQYGELKENYNPHKAALTSLKKYGLDSKLDPTLRQPCGKLLYKDIYKDQVQDKDKKKESPKISNEECEQIWQEYKSKFPGVTKGPKAFDRLKKAIRSENDLKNFLQSIENYAEMLSLPENNYRKPKTSLSSFIGTDSSGYFWEDFIEYDLDAAKAEMSKQKGGSVDYSAIFERVQGA